jgi:hypothetical protein
MIARNDEIKRQGKIKANENRNKSANLEKLTKE